MPIAQACTAAASAVPFPIEPITVVAIVGMIVVGFCAMQVGRMLGRTETSDVMLDALRKPLR